jgi:nitroimidazol reductase NimA-like FMN-containing flavoprotein (pyridoxamine 5'-phosphate oxidase superfamily)
MFHIRRTEKAIEEFEVLKRILKSTNYVTLAMSVNDQPYLVSLSHVYDEKNNCIYFHCAPEGKKLEYLSVNNRVWGQALLEYGYFSEEEECDHLYASVHFSGRVTFLEDTEEKLQAMALMMNHVKKKTETTKSFDYHRLDRTKIGRINIENLSGKKSSRVIL